MALYVLFWFLAIARIGAAVPTLIALCLPPVLVTLWSVVRGREQLDCAAGACWLLALAGTVLVVLRHGGAGAAPCRRGQRGRRRALSVGSAAAVRGLYAGQRRACPRRWAPARRPRA